MFAFLQVFNSGRTSRGGEFPQEMCSAAKQVTYQTKRKAVRNEDIQLVMEVTERLTIFLYTFYLYTK